MRIEAPRHPKNDPIEEVEDILTILGRESTKGDDPIEKLRYNQTSIACPGEKHVQLDANISFTYDDWRVSPPHTTTCWS